VTWRLLLPIGGVGLVAVVAAATLPLAGAVALATVAVALAAGLAEVLVAGRLRRAAAEVETWLRQEHHRALRLPPGGGWRELETALNALGAAYQRRGIKLRRERPWRRELVDSLVSPALLVSAEDRLLAANDAARSLLGISDDARALTVLEASGSPALAGAVHEARDTGVPVTLDVEHGQRDLRCVVSLVGDELLVILTDRTQEQRVEELRRNFVVNASHELKTPVTSIRTLSEALEVTARQDPEQIGPLVARLSGEAERLARLVYDLLDLRRLEERAPVETDPVDLAWLVRDVAAELVDRAERREVELGVEAPDRLVLAGSEGDLRIVVKNLVANAIQYNRPSGSVEVVLTATPEGALLSVGDTGIGIPAHDRQRIFERFYRVDAARSRETGGTGLGLSLVRHAVERHGGTITVDSEPGVGTTFTVRLPAGAGAGSDAQ
jgi:two-component system, OmpR family, phosphate regulon sensor histidine kinase PhoR